MRGSAAVGHPARPARDLGLGDGADERLVAADRLAVERRQQQPAQAQVALAVGHDDRRARERADRRVGLAAAEDVRVAGEDLRMSAGSETRRTGRARRPPA
jgi:hypothetical protein